MKKFLMIHLNYDCMEPEVFSKEEVIAKLEPRYTYRSEMTSVSVEEYLKKNWQTIQDFLKNADAGDYMTEPELIFCVVNYSAEK